MRPPDVLSPDGGCQTIARIVGPPQNLIFIIKDGYTDHRAEDLALHDGIFLFCVCQQRRSEIVTFTFRLTSASNHTDMAEAFASSTAAVTRFRCASELNGPSSVDSSSGAPIFRLLTAFPSFSTSAS